jgi:hypothetical protein
MHAAKVKTSHPNVSRGGDGTRGFPPLSAAKLQSRLAYFQP